MNTRSKHLDFPQLIRNNFEEITPLGNQQKRSFLPVFKAREIHSGKLKVIKWISIPASNPKSLYALENEACFSFDQNGLPNDVKVLRDKNTIVIHRDFIQGIPLDHYWKKLKFADRLVTLKTICRGLAPIFSFLKEQNSVHCDIKPSNVLISETNDMLSVQLIDFGLALRTTERIERQVLFPLGYAAPELILNRLHLVDQRTDIFSLGVMIWRLLSGELPFNHANPSIYTNLQLTQPLPEHQYIPSDWMEFLRKSTVKPYFRTSPNHLSHEEIDQLLVDAMQNRFTGFDTFIDAMDELSSHQKWWKKYV